MTTLHVLTSPYSAVNINHRTDPFSILALKFIKHMMDYGWNVIHYSIEGTEVPCETVQCVDKSSGDNSADAAIYNQRAGQAIAERKQPGDMIVCFHGWENRGAADANPDLRVVEPSIGYEVGAVFAPYRVFTSYSHMHMYYGAKGMLMNPSWFDAVIPNAITASEFEFSSVKEDYFLYFGRVIESKGIHIAIQATQETGQRLVIAGGGDLRHLGYNEVPSHVTIAGVCDAEKRKVLMKGAKAIIGATHYVEPFGNMVAEGYMAGTPAITTDWGGFTDTVVPGVTGFRCREMREFVHAIKNIDDIDPKDCRKYAMKNYEDAVVHKKLHEYFIRIQESNFYRK